MIRRRFANLLLLTLALASTTVRADNYGSGWYGEVALDLGHEDNLARSFRDEDVTDDQRATASVGGGYAFNAGQRWRHVYSGYVSYTAQQEYDKLDNLAGSLGASIDFQPGAAYDSFWFSGIVDVTYRDYRDSDAREGYLFRGSLRANRRLTSRLTGRVGYRYIDLVFLNKDEAEKQRDAAFDIARHEGFLGFDVQLAGNTYLVAEYSYAHGGFTTTASAPPDPSVTYDAQTTDPVFESCNAIRCTPWSAYRSVSDIHSVELALAFPVGGLDFDLSGRYVNAESEAGLTYDNYLVQLAMMWSF